MLRDFSPCRSALANDRRRVFAAIRRAERGSLRDRSSGRLGGGSQLHLATLARMPKRTHLLAMPRDGNTRSRFRVRWPFFVLPAGAGAPTPSLRQSLLRPAEN
jgi:hypothetical protein